MAEDKMNTGPEDNSAPEAPMPESPDIPPAPDLNEEKPTGPEQEAQTAPGDVVVSVEKIEELMAERRAAAREAIEQAEPDVPAEGPGKDNAADERPVEESPEQAEQTKPRRGRLPKEDKAEPGSEKAAKPRKGRPAKADKAAPDEAQPPKPRDTMSRSEQTAPVKEEPPAPEQSPEPGPPPRPVEDGQLVYLKLSELHAFHTFRDHPYKVTDDDKMTELVGTIKEHGVMTPATVRPEKDGNGYEIIAGHRRHHGSALAGLEEMPCIVRNMSDLEAVREMKISNKQRGDPLPSELARLLDLEVEAIKHQGARPGESKEDMGKRSVEIVGESNGMNYKKVMRYIRLNSLTPELMNMVDDKKLGFMPAVELSYLKPKNQRLVAVSIEGEQSKPSVAQAKRLRELDKDGKLNGDIIDGILSEQKKEDRGVIISTAELEKYFGKEVTPAKMKEQIISLLDNWKEKQPPELAKPEKKADLEK